jgi:FkbM family methyltransferase
MRSILWRIARGLPLFRGKSRLFALLARPSQPLGVVIRRPDGAFRIHGHDLNEWYLATQESHSPEVAACLDRLTAASASISPPVLWDIGANIGAITIPFLCRNPSARAVCFEPSPEVTGRLIGNLALNPSATNRATVVTSPLASGDGVIKFYTSSETFNSGAGGLGSSHNRCVTPIFVHGVRGDTAIATWNLPIPTVIKIDVEGFELEVLQGMHHTLTTHRPAVIFEHSLYRLREHPGRAATAVSQFLHSLGYEICDLSGQRPISNEALNGDCDLLAVHSAVPHPVSGQVEVGIHAASPRRMRRCAAGVR